MQFPASGTFAFCLPFDVIIRKVKVSLECSLDRVRIFRFDHIQQIQMLRNEAVQTVLAVKRQHLQAADA